MSGQATLWDDADDATRQPRELPADGTCPHCGGKMVEYVHHLNEPLVLALRRLYVAAGGGPVHLRDVALTYSQRCNFQKLRYFGLVDQAEPGKRTGRWRITDAGVRFLRGDAECYESVWTWRGEFARWGGERVRLRDVVGDYEQREEWAAEAVPHERTA